jgi:hypothetical protein
MRAKNPAGGREHEREFQADAPWKRMLHLWQDSGDEQTQTKHEHRSMLALASAHVTRRMSISSYEPATPLTSVAV